MRSRILRVALGAVALAVVVLGVPAGYAVSRVVSDGARGRLERTALAAAVLVSPSVRSGDPVELGAAPQGIRVAVYDVHGERLGGVGPAHLDTAGTAAATGHATATSTGGMLAEVVPVSGGERVVALVRAATPDGSVRRETLLWWALLLVGCLVAGALAAAVAAWEAHRLSVRVGDLTRMALRLGDGDFALQPPVSGVEELDSAGAALARTADRLRTLIEHEQAFAAHASHQLRTPLTRLRLRLERGLAGDEPGLRAAADDALEVVDRLTTTVEDVLRAARPETGPQCVPARVVRQLAEEWRGILAEEGRRLQVRLDDGLTAAVSAAALRQVCLVLLENAQRHGRGTVSVDVRDAYGAVALDVRDEGSGAPFDPRGGAGLGLGLVASLVDAAQGRLVVDRSSDTRVTVLLEAPGLTSGVTPGA